MVAIPRKRIAISLAGLLFLAAVAVFLVIGVDSGTDGSVRSSGAASPSGDSALMTAPSMSGVTATPSSASLLRIVIPRIGVDAPITVKGMGADGVMEAPDGPEDVAWYGFTARPGSGGNAVFSAHLDYHNYGPAVFADLNELQNGDLVEVYLADGAVYRYEVVLSLSYSAETAPSEDIVGPTSREVITLITCAGSFDQASRRYSHRLVVRAERMRSGAISAPASLIWPKYLSSYRLPPPSGSDPRVPTYTYTVGMHLLRDSSHPHPKGGDGM
jgi:LPXTG-site transpeptidase (sortase) family protein